ncbi:MAG: acyltransferase [Deltaproteobacteria bacterium]|nr:acyltransferase [Deltaproteobacteria bacterium]
MKISSIFGVEDPAKAGCGAVANSKSIFKVMREKSSLSQPYFHGFDYLRAVMSVAIVAWHIQLFGASNLFDLKNFADHNIVLSDIINFYFLLLAVPVFFLISLFLFFQKIVINRSYFKKRITRLLLLYLFWVGLWLLLYGCLTNFSNIFPSSFKDILISIISGWSSLYYFFFSLILLTCIACAIIRLPDYLLWLLLVICSSLLWCFPLIVKIYGEYHFLVAYWNPFNFLPYLFIAALFLTYFKKGYLKPSSKYFKLLIVCLFFVFITTAIFEWHWIRDINYFKYNAMVIPPYTRISVVVGATLLFCLSFFIKGPSGSGIKFLSNYSLGLYCLHGFASIFYIKLMGCPNDFPGRFLEFLVVMVASLLSTVVLFNRRPFFLRS